MRAGWQVAPQVHQIPVGRASVFLLLGDRVAVIDAGWRSSGPDILWHLASLGRGPQDIAYFVATHYHPDHIGGLSYLGLRSPGLVAIHEAEAPFLQGLRSFPSPFHNRAVAAFATPLVALTHPPRLRVDLPLHDGSILEVLGGVQVIHSPGHTAGSISLYLPQRGVLIVGDALVYRRSKLGLPSLHFTEDMSLAKASDRRLVQLDFEVLCFSHFRPMRKHAGRALREFAESLG